MMCRHLELKAKRYPCLRSGREPLASILCMLLCLRAIVSVSSFASIHFTKRSRIKALQFEYDDFSEFDLSNDHSSINAKPLNGNVHPKIQFSRLRNIITSSPISYSNEISNNIITKLESSGFIDDNDVTNFAKGFVEREEVLSQVLISDFSWDAMDAHRARVGIIELVRQEIGSEMTKQSVSPRKETVATSSSQSESTLNVESNASIEQAEDITLEPEPKEEIKQASWKSVLVNDKAKLRRAKKQNEDNTHINKDTYSYGLFTSDQKTYPTLFLELDNYWGFMTVPQTSTLAEPPIREKTAEVYRTHARLFLGELSALQI